MDEATPDGPEVVYYDNGNVKSRGGYLDGEMHGAWEFFRRDGSTMRTGVFDRGRQVGIWRSYDRDSIVTNETDFGDAADDDA
jgi:antitoxin component YwqK of YwqJK toxin-antitoxin module